MGFARCGVEGNLRKLVSSTRKKTISFFFVNLKKMKMVFASVSFSSPLLVAVARTSQSPFPLSASVKNRNPNKDSGLFFKAKNYKI